MQKIKALVLGVIMLAFVGTALAPAPAAVALTPKEEVCKGIDNTTNCGAATGISINNLIRNIVLLLSTIVGVAAIIMIIVSGLKYTTSGGDSSSIASAKNTLIYALVGLVIAAMAQFIVRFVLRTAS